MNCLLQWDLSEEVWQTHMCASLVWAHWVPFSRYLMSFTMLRYRRQYVGHAFKVGWSDKDWPHLTYWVPLWDTQCLLQWGGTGAVSWLQDGWKHFLNTNTQIQMDKPKHTNTDAQIQIRKVWVGTVLVYLCLKMDGSTLKAGTRLNPTDI